MHAILGPLRFGVFEFDPRSGELRRRGMLVRLTPQARILLGMLLEPPLRMRTREEIQQRLWSSNTYVDFERGVNKIVHSLRSALGETASSPRFIETVAGEGYRFLPQLVEQTFPDRSREAMPRSAWLAVLPIEAEPELMPAGDRIASYLTDELSMMHGVRVLANSTVKSRNLEGCSPRQAGKSLGVRAVIAGELTRRDSGISLRLELIDVADGALLRGARVESASQSAEKEEDLAHEILGQIQPVNSAPVPIRKPPVPVAVLDREEAAG